MFSFISQQIILSYHTLYPVFSNPRSSPGTVWYKFEISLSSIPISDILQSPHYHLTNEEYEYIALQYTAQELSKRDIPSFHCPSHHCWGTKHLSALLSITQTSFLSISPIQTFIAINSSVHQRTPRKPKRHLLSKCRLGKAFHPCPFMLNCGLRHPTFVAQNCTIIPPVYKLFTIPVATSL